MQTEAGMRPREQSRGQDDLFRSRLDQIIDMKRPLIRLGGLDDRHAHGISAMLETRNRHIAGKTDRIA